MLHAFSVKSNIKVNVKKSAVMVVRQDKITRSNLQTLFNFPVVNSYRYLGINIEDDLKFDLEDEHRKKLITKLTQ